MGKLFVIGAIFLLQYSNFQSKGIGNVSKRDTTLVGKLIDTDSISQKLNYEYQRVKYYYGVHHFKVALLDLINPEKNGDTVILAYVHNKRADSRNILKISI